MWFNGWSGMIGRRRLSVVDIINYLSLFVGNISSGRAVHRAPLLPGRTAGPSKRACLARLRSAIAPWERPGRSLRKPFSNHMQSRFPVKSIAVFRILSQVDKNNCTRARANRMLAALNDSQAAWSANNWKCLIQTVSDIILKKKSPGSREIMLSNCRGPL